MPVDNRMTGPEEKSWLQIEIMRQGEVLRRVLSRQSSSIAEAVSGRLARSPRDWVATGCGDSLFAGMCAEYWFAEACGTPLRAIHALAFSRYLYRSVDEHSVVFAVSYSGNTARVVEAAVAAKARGAQVIAITANGQSRLAKIADWWLVNEAEGERSNCRTGSFQAACLLFRSFATRLAQTQARDRDGAPGLADPEALPNAVDALAAACAGPVRAIVDALPDNLTFVYIGGGYGYPVAWYGASKLYEAATIAVHTAELEQFVHCDIFPIDRRSCVVMVAPAGPSYARAVEVAGGLRQLGAITIGISDDPAFAAHCAHFVGLPGGWDEDAIPFLACIPLQHFALDWAVRLGQNPDLVSNKAVNRPLIERSEQWTGEDYARRQAAPAGGGQD